MINSSARRVVTRDRRDMGKYPGGLPRMVRFQN